jgi:general secretion pathway protein K
MKKQRGLVLVLVLWVSVLITVLASAYILSARIEATQARTLVATAQARYAAEAGLYRAAWELRSTDPQNRWIADGRSYQTRFGRAELDIRIHDETGKLDLNGSDQLTLAQFFESNGLPTRDATALAARIMDWRDPDDLITEPGGAEKADYTAEGLAWEPRNRPFETINEVMQVLGVDYELYRRLEPSLTIHSGMNRPAPAFASAEVLAALYPQVPLEQLQELVRQRQQLAPGQSVTMPDGMVLVVSGGGLSFTIQVRATLDSGERADLEATVQLGMGSVGGRPFRVLRWRDSES